MKSPNNEVRQLIVGRIPKDFDPTTHIAMGPWCFIDAEDIYPDWETLNFPVLFQTPEKMENAAQDVRLLCDYYLQLWAEKLNIRHGTTLGLPFWRILIVPWIVDVLELCWFRYHETKVLVDNNPGIQFYTNVLPENMNWNFTDLNDFSAAITGQKFSSWVTSLVLFETAFSNVVLAPEPGYREYADSDALAWKAEGGVSWVKQVYRNIVSDGRFSYVQLHDRPSIMTKTRHFAVALWFNGSMGSDSIDWH